MASRAPVPLGRTPPRRSRNHHSAGGLVVRGEEVLLIAPRRGRWQLPKGRIEPGEQAAEAAVREVREETGVAGRVVATLPSIEYFYLAPGGIRIAKLVDYYLMDYEDGSASDHDPREVEEARWFPWERALSALTYDNEREVVAVARRLAQQRERR
ncbi:MAG TPA: NUDIX hydrolase [Thermoanaerobaculia bacterium]|nr:NUDIX hydrolase [Thermoanaerobaculia bacterium]